MAGVVWYVDTREFATARWAQNVFNTLHGQAKRRSGKDDLGVYRHGPEDDPGRLVTLVGFSPETINDYLEKAGGLPFVNDEKEDKALVLRRANVLNDLLNKGALGGSYRIDHGEGAELREDGSFDE
jgi:hypothetical protein